MSIEFLSEIPSTDEYRALRQKCGLSPRSQESADTGLPRSLYGVVARENGVLIAMGRLIGDGGCHVQITDIAVDPAFQGQGIGRKVMESIMAFIAREIPRTCFVNLFADVDFLYQKFGFSQAKSKGMCLDWSKLEELSPSTYVERI